MMSSNNFNGNNKFNGVTQVAGRDINNYYSNNSDSLEPKHEPKVVWDTPFTKKVLSMISLVIGILEVISGSKLVGFMLNFSTLLKNGVINSGDNFQLVGMMSVFLPILLFFFLRLRVITQKETRRPIFFNYAISGYGNKLKIEKMQIAKCSICGGTMKYYNRIIDKRPAVSSDGTVKTQVLKKSPAIACKRNSDHFWLVDPAENKI